MKRLDDDPAEQYVKMGLTGDSGIGKTWLAVTAPDPLVLIWERQAKASIEACCAATGLPKPMMILIESIADCGNVLRALHGDRTRPCTVYERYTDEKKRQKKRLAVQLPRWPLTLVTDSLTDACAMMRAELHKEAPPKADPESGLPDESYAHRRVLLDRCSQLIRAFRNVPAHVVFLCLKNEQKIYRGKKVVGRRWVADLPDKDLPARYMAACNIVGVPYIRKGHRGVILDADDWMGCKALPPLRSFEVPDLSEWIARIQGEWKGAPTAAPPMSEDAEDLRQRGPEDVDVDDVDGETAEPDLSFGFEGTPAAAEPDSEEQGDGGADAETGNPDDPDNTTQAKRTITCGHCKEQGHNIRSCPLLADGKPGDGEAGAPEDPA